MSCSRQRRHQSPRQKPPNTSPEALSRAHVHISGRPAKCLDGVRPTWHRPQGRQIRGVGLRGLSHRSVGPGANPSPVWPQFPCLPHSPSLPYRKDDTRRPRSKYAGKLKELCLQGHDGLFLAGGLGQREKPMVVWIRCGSELLGRAGGLFGPSCPLPSPPLHRWVNRGRLGGEGPAPGLTAGGQQGRLGKQASWALPTIPPEGDRPGGEEASSKMALAPH